LPKTTAQNLPSRADDFSRVYIEPDFFAFGQSYQNLHLSASKVNSVNSSKGWILLIQGVYSLHRKGNTHVNVNIVRKEGVNSPKLEILTEIEMSAKEEMRRMGSDLWRKPRVRCNGIRSGRYNF
jgi:hypothetical protein